MRLNLPLGATACRIDRSGTIAHMSHAEVERERIPQFQQYHRLRLALEVEDIGVQEMADYLGVERNSVSRWINGRTQPSKQTLRLWAMRTGVPLEWLETGLPRLDSNQEPTDSPFALVIDMFTGERVA